MLNGTGSATGNVGIGTTNTSEKLTVAGTVRLGSNSSQVYIGGNLGGCFIKFNDDLWFNDPQNGQIYVYNGPCTGWGTMVGYFNAPSSVEFKKDIVVLEDSDFNQLLEDTLDTNLVRFRYNEEDETHRLHLGVIIEDSPLYISGEGGKSLSLPEYVAMVHGSVKALSKQLSSLRQGFYVDETTSNVGIGTTSPDYKLHVLGDVGAQSFVNISSGELKKDISYLAPEETEEMLNKLKGINIARYHYLGEEANTPLRLGLVAEESPQEILSVSGKGVDIYKFSTFTLAGLQKLARQVEELKSATQLTVSQNPQTGLIETNILKVNIVQFTNGNTIRINADGFVEIETLAVERLKVKKGVEVGSPEDRIGVTLYDRATGEPYCVFINNGELTKVWGKCVTAETELVAEVSTQTNTDETYLSHDTAVIDSPADDTLISSSSDTLDLGESDALETNSSSGDAVILNSSPDTAMVSEE